MLLTSLVLSGFALSFIAPWLHKVTRGMTGWILAALPAGLACYFATLLFSLAPGEAILVSQPWLPSIGITLSFRADGLGLLFAVIISGVGALVTIYAGGYLAGHRDLGRLYAYLMAFMASMLGVVLADNLVLLFVFWELTSLTSYFLIGFHHDRADSRASALQALLVTGGGGLALLAGLVMMGIAAGGEWSLSAILSSPVDFGAHPLYLPMFILLLFGAGTKSAQFPFHFWLPSAMVAPTPVSAYLHSATMVKAGVYLLARLAPALGGTPLWQHSLTILGGVTMVVGAYLVWFHTDLKRVLAYSTVSALGTLVMLLGWPEPTAAKAAVLFLLVHSLYKGALFLVAGAIDHETGTRDISVLGGLRAAMPVTAVAAGLAGLSMAGVPPLVGFMGKELVYEASMVSPVFLVMAVAAGVTNVVVAGLVGFRPFFARVAPPGSPHEAPPNMWLGPMVLAVLGVLTGLFTGLVGDRIIAPAASAVAGRSMDVSLPLLKKLSPMYDGHWNVVLFVSIATVVAGVGAYLAWVRIRRALAPLAALERIGPARGYDVGLNGLLSGAKWQTRLLQSGYLRSYLLIVMLTTVVLAAVPLWRHLSLAAQPLLPDARSFDWAVVVLITLGALLAVNFQSRFAAVVALGAVGYGVALLFMLYSAPDLAVTQFAVDTLTVVLFVIILCRLPRMAKLAGRVARIRDMIVAGAGGLLMTLFVLVVTTLKSDSRITPYFVENSLPMAHGRNIVNVILVDFRALDTLGEITVVAVAALGVYALLKLRLDRGDVE